MAVSSTNTFSVKSCCHCKETKSTALFVKCKDSIHTYCKKCHSLKSKVWRENNKEKHKAQQKKYRESRGYEGRKDSVMRSKYGISLDKYNEMLSSQHFCCAICHGEDTWEFDVFVVDHCHETGVVRGLPCTKCNKGLGMFRDSILALENAANYLRRF